MASTGKKWGIGCGIGCLVIILFFGGIGTIGYFSVKDIIDEADTMDDTFAAMDSTFGQPEDFAPAFDGRIPADRIEVFLAARAVTEPARVDASETIGQLDHKGDNAPGNVFTKIRAGIAFVPAMLRYADRRNRALLDHDMGLGEYQYLYALAYFSYLEKDPGDGPNFRMHGSDDGDDDGDGGTVHWGVQVNDSSGDVRRERADFVRRGLNRNLAAMAQNQLTALDAQLAAGADPQLAVWREELAGELEKMREEPRRILWEEGLPAPLRDSLEPFRDRFDASYDSLLNVVEMGLVDHD